MSLSDLLALCVEHDDIVTVKCFAISHGLTVLETAALFKEFVDGRSLIVRYLLSGSLKEKPGTGAFRVVAERDLSEAEKAFEKPPTRTIFSVQKNECRDYSNVAFIAQEDKCSEALSAKPNCEHFVRNLYGGIHTDLTVNPFGERVYPSQPSRPPAAEKALVSMLTSKVEYKSAKNNVEPTKFFEKSDSRRPSKVTTNENDKNHASLKESDQSSAVESCLNTSEGLPAATSKVTDGNNDNNENQERPTTATGLDVNSDDEWDDGYKPDKTKLHERQKAFGAPEGTGGAYQPDIDSDHEEASGTKANSPVAKKQRHFVRGAIDDFVGEQGTVDADRNVSKKRKLVPKVRRFMDVQLLRIYSNVAV